MFNHLNVGEQIDHITKAALIQFRSCKVFRENILEAFVILLNTPHRIVNDCPNLRGVSCCGDDTPASILWHKENVFCKVLINILFKTISFSNKLLIFCLEAVGNIFEENQTQHN